MDWSIIPSLSSLRAFEAASRLGSYSHAAQELNVTHAAIAQHVRQLEEHFGSPLMQRQGRGMRTTAQGTELARALSDAFGTIATASGRLMDQQLDAPLRISTTPAFASLWLMPRIGLFWQDHPDIEIEILPTDKLIDFRADGIDLAVRYGRGNWPGLRADRLMQAGYVAVAHPDYPIAWDSDLVLSEHTLFTYGTSNQEAINWLRAQGFYMKLDDFTFIPDAQLVRQAALSKRGIAILTTPAVADDLANGTLRSVSRKISEDHAYYIVRQPNVVNKKRDLLAKWLLSSSK